MRKKHPHFFKMLLISVAFTLLLSCEEESFENTAPQSNLKVYIVKGNQAKTMATKISQKLNKPLSQKGTTFKINNDVVVDYSEIMVVENEAHDKTLSLKVESNAENEKVFQNMVVIEKEGTTATKLLTYTMSENFATLYENDQANLSQFQGSISVTTIDGEDCCSDYWPGIIQIGGGGSDGINPNTGNTQPSQGPSTSSPSFGWGIWIGGGGTSGGGSSSGGGSGSSSGGTPEMCPSGMHLKGDPQCRYTKVNNTPILSNRLNANAMSTINPNSGTPPSLCCIYDIGLFQEAMHEQDCEKLNKLGQSDNQNIKPEIQWLKNKVLANEQVEYGVEFEQYGYHNPVTGIDDTICNNTHVTGTPFIQTGSSVAEATVTLTVGPKNIGGAHSHIINKGSHMFSFGDIKTLLEMYDYALPKRKHLVTYMIVCNNPQDPQNPLTYALTVNDFNALSLAFNSVWNNPKYSLNPNEITGNPETDDRTKLTKIHNVLAREYKNNSNNLEKYFLQKFGSFGISLYKADNNLDNWSQLELDSSSGTLVVQPKPCN